MTVQKKRKQLQTKNNVYGIEHFNMLLVAVISANLVSVPEFI